MTFVVPNALTLNFNLFTVHVELNVMSSSLKAVQLALLYWGLNRD